MYCNVLYSTVLYNNVLYCAVLTHRTGAIVQMKSACDLTFDLVWTIAGTIVQTMTGNIVQIKSNVELDTVLY